MKRFFWSTLLLLMTLSSGWAIYVGAQEFQGLLTETSPEETRGQLRYQFTDHFFLEGGLRSEVLLKLDRVTGETWRFTASQAAWTPIAEPSENARPVASGEHRYELLSHIYRDPAGAEHELFVRVDYADGYSWSYKGMADSWTEIAVKPRQDLGRASAKPTLKEKQGAGEES